MNSLVYAYPLRLMKSIVALMVLAAIVLVGSDQARAQSPLSLDSNHAWLVIASHASRDASVDLARRYASRFPTAAVLRSSNGNYAVVLGWASKNRLRQFKSRLVDERTIPHDSYLSGGTRFLSAVWPSRVASIYPESAQPGAMRLAWNAQQPAPAQSRSIGRVTGLDPTGDNFLSLRTGPGSRFSELDRLSQNELVSIVGRSGKWFKVVTPAGTTGWVFGRYITVGSKPVKPSPEKIVTKSDVDRFVRKFNRLSQVDTSKLRNLYASKVQWYDKGYKSVAEIVEEKNNLFDKWPTRENTIRKLEISPLGSNRFLVNYTIRFDLANADARRCGHWDVELLVAKYRNGPLRIEREDGRDLHRDCTPAKVVAPSPDTQPEVPDPGLTSSPQTKVALVIGNGRYSNAPELENPSNDASAMARVLQGMGFTVIQGVDLKRPGMENKIADFARAAATADVSLFFYAGHGIQVSGRNYLVPVEATVKDRTSLAFELIDVQKVTQFMGGNGKTSIILLDACRDNPLTRSLARSLGSSRSSTVGQGLAPIRAEHGGMLIGFATAPGDVAADGDGMANSPFTTALLKHLPTPGLEIELAMKKVKAEVLKLTANKQRPWHNSDLAREIYLVSKE
ncbi:MAG: caspase family protein [Pseudomonadota bacterium]